MPQVINTNIMSLNAQRNLNTSQSAMAVAVQRLSSGLRVNSAKDDAAGLAIAERMQAQSRGMSVAMRNASDAISLAQTAEGALSAITTALQRMRELAVQSANGTYSDADDRPLLDAEFQELALEITRVATDTEFNGLAILGGDAGTFTFQVGANSGQTIDVTTTDLSGDATITAVTGGDITTAATADQAIQNIDAALNTVNTQRSTYGAAQARFESVVNMLQISKENQEAARSRIMDADYAAETAALTRAQILQQAGVAMLAQANAMPQNVLSLLRG
jgi:flagellin